MGFAEFYKEVFRRLSIKLSDQVYLCTGIDRINRNKNKNRIRHASAEFKRARKHGEMARKREAVLDSRTDDYKTGVAVGINSNDNDSENSEKEEHDTKEKKTKKKFCKWCDGLTDHTTWRAKSCIAHNEYQKWIEEKKTKRKSAEKEREKKSNSSADSGSVSKKRTQ